MAQTEAHVHDYSKLPPVIHAIIHEDDLALDPEAGRFLPILQKSAAPEIWHKHGHFYSHLHDVWQMLCAWKQPQAICRLGLFHSAYSNSFVAMNLYDPDTEAGRQVLRDVVGKEAENLVWKFCVIDRLSMEDEVAATGKIPAEGKDFEHIRTGEKIHCTAEEIGAFVIETLADYQDQSFGWQSDMERRRRQALWPGVFKPTLRMSKVSIMAKAARDYGHLAAIPPIFDNCTSILTPEKELEARELYWTAMMAEAEEEMSAATRDELISKLARSSELNPWVAEPHVARAQLLMQKEEWDLAADAVKKGLQIFYDWATQWDNRMPFVAWVAWARCILLQASLKEWPMSHGGTESLGAVQASQKFRKLNPERSLKRKAEQMGS